MIAIRLSTGTDITTSPERQLNDCTAYCEARGWKVIGIAQDLDISASVRAPWTRPELSKWLDRAPEFDNIVFWRLDRFVRKVGDLQTMIEWAGNHGDKGLFSATEPFDLHSPSGRIMATMIAVFARMEALAAAERVSSMRAHLLTTPRWGGGRPPYGYRTVQKEDGKYLEIDPVRQEVVQAIAEAIIAGMSVNAIARDLEERGIPAPWESNKKSKDTDREWLWHPATIKKIMESPATEGWKTRTEPVAGKSYRKTVPVLDTQGERVRQAPPLIAEPEKYAELRMILAGTAIGGFKPVEPATPFLGVLKCGGCGKNMNLHVTKKKRLDGSYREKAKIRCLSRTGSPACKGFAFEPESEIVIPLMNAIIYDIGDQPVTRRVYVRGDGTADRIAEIEQSTEYRIRQLRPGGLFESGPARAEGERSLTELNREWALLDERDIDRDRWEYEELGVTFGERWGNQTYSTIRSDLLKAGITMDCFPSRMGGHVLNVPKDLRERFAKVPFGQR